VSAIDSKLQALLDRAEISEIVIRYATGVDQRDWQLFKTCFTEEIEANLENTPVGAAFGTRVLPVDQWVSAVSNGISDYTTTLHYSTNHRIELGQDTANCSSYMEAFHFWPDEAGRPNTFKVGGYYQYVFVRTGLGWKISKCKITVTWQEGDGARSLGRYRQV
jgi:3-phenylpropionate/cinnamic acid dioxygenase small subunit